MAPLSRHDEGQAASPAAVVADTGQPVSVQPSQPRIWYRRPSAQGLLALALYVAVWLATGGRHLVQGLGDAHLDQVSMDPNFYTWCLKWWPYAIGHGLNPFYSHLVRAPMGHSLAWVTAIPPIALLATPLTLTAGPLVTFNLLVIMAPPLAAWAAFVLCRRLTRKFWPSLAGGAVFGFSAYEINHIAAGQLNLTYSLLLPLLAYLVVLWRENAIGTRAFVVLAGLTMAVQFYLFLETFADLTVLLAVSLAVGIAVAGRTKRPEMLRLARHLGYAYVIGILLALPYLAYALTIKTPVLHGYTNLDMMSLAVPRPSSVTSISWLYHLSKEAGRSSDAGYVGIPLLLLAVLLAVTGWSSRLVRFLAGMLAFVILAAFGSVLYVDGGQVFSFPWARLWQLPIVRNAYPSRLMLFAYLALAVMTAVWLARTQASRWLRLTLGVLVVAGLVQDVGAFDVYPRSTLPTFISSGAYRTQLSRGETVVVVSTVGNAGMLWQAETNFYVRLAGGYINQSITKGSDLPRAVQRLAKASPAGVTRFENYLREARIGAILVDRNHAPKWVGMFWRVGLKGHPSGNVVVYEVNGCRSCRALGWAQIPHGHHAGSTAPAGSPL
ncbi:MAG TPA: hypothetical protein VEV45_21855 [Streptosporangiaceae bacterium]|nr:hypothetical protein [Streptosporangiaceae bacterium]